jgi:hypothetical protein
VSEYRRRRRIEPEPERKGIPLLPLLLVVVFAGLLLGGLLAKFLGRGPIETGATSPAFSPVPSITPIVTAPPSAALAPLSPHTPAPSPSAAASATPSAAPVARQTREPLANATATPATLIVTPPPKASAPSPSIAPTAVAQTAAPSVAPSPSPVVQSTPASAAVAAPTAAPVLNATPPPGSAGARAIVRSYLRALARGDQATATGYLSSGLPNESFMSRAATINTIDASENSDGTYKVTADVTTSQGEYFETFQVEKGPYGLQISDHYAIKVQ